MASDDIQLCALAQTALCAGSQDIILERNSSAVNDEAMSDGPIGDLSPSREPSSDGASAEDEAPAAAKVEEDIPGLSSAARQLKALTTTFPLDKAQMRKVVSLVEKCSPKDLQRLGYAAPKPLKAPKNLDKLPIEKRMKIIQAIISSFQYNHTGTNYFNVNKDRPFNRIMDTARDIQRDELPIKCIEGAILGLFFTCGQEDLDRLALRFKTVAGGQVYRHIVLAVHHKPSSTWGALGLSRRKELMFKEMRFSSLADLVTDFKESYEKWWHKVQKIRIGLPAEHSLFYSGRVNWCFTVAKGGCLTYRISSPHYLVQPQAKTWEHWCALFDKHAAKMNKAAEVWRQMGADAVKGGRGGPEWVKYRRASLMPPQKEMQKRSGMTGNNRNKTSKGSSKKSKTKGTKADVPVAASGGGGGDGSDDSGYDTSRASTAEPHNNRVGAAYVQTKKAMAQRYGLNQSGSKTAAVGGGAADKQATGKAGGAIDVRRSCDNNNSGSDNEEEEEEEDDDDDDGDEDEDESDDDSDAEEEEDSDGD